MIVCKSIKPARFRSEAFRQHITTAANQVANGIEADFRATTATWEHKPAFEKIVDTVASPVQILVGTDDPIYAFVDMGTRPHAIFPRNAKVLAFPSAYSAKTSPGVIGSSGGGSSGSTVFAAYVQHPGTAPRNFDETIARKWAPRFKAAMEAALRAGATATGYGI